MDAKIAELLADVERPVLLDTAGVCQLVEALEGEKPAEETVRRWPLRYKLIGRTRRYEANHVISFVRQRYAAAPVRMAARSRQPAP